MKRRFSKVRAIREARGLRQIDLVILTGLSLGTIGHFDKGNQVSPTSVQKIAKALGVQPESIQPAVKRLVSHGLIKKLPAAK